MYVEKESHSGVVMRVKAGIPRGNKTQRISDFTGGKYVTKLKICRQTSKNISLKN